MAVDLGTLPPELEPPSPPRLRRWGVFVVAFSLAGCALVVLFWPTDSLGKSLWFWCSALVLPWVSGLSIFAVRQLEFEKRDAYVAAWNRNRGRQESSLIRKGQRAVALLNSAYVSGGGGSELAVGLLGGSKPLRSLMWPGLATEMRLNPLDAGTAMRSTHSYTSGLKKHLTELVQCLRADLAQCGRGAPLRVRIRHNQILKDEQVASIWHECRETTQPDDIEFDPHADGLLWLDRWLDEAEPDPLIVSVEINLFMTPVEEQVESISVLIFALAEWARDARLPAHALIHRPVRVDDVSLDLERAMLWGGIPATDPDHFIWHSQLSVDAVSTLSIALSAAGQSPRDDGWHALNDSLGWPACAVGHISLIVATEHARAQDKAQLVALQDASMQLCVVQPVRHS